MSDWFDQPAGSGARAAAMTSAARIGANAPGGLAKSEASERTKRELALMKTLYAKLAAVSLSLFFAIGIVYVLITLYATQRHFEEVQQRLNLELADHLVAESIVTPEGSIDDARLKDVFHMLMVINPSIELYLLDRDGGIRAYSAPPGTVVREAVSLEPIERFLAEETLPILGDDPRDAGRGEGVLGRARRGPRLHLRDPRERGVRIRRADGSGELHPAAVHRRRDLGLRVHRRRRARLVSLAHAQAEPPGARHGSLQPRDGGRRARSPPRRGIRRRDRRPRRVLRKHGARHPGPGRQARAHRRAQARARRERLS